MSRSASPLLLALILVTGMLLGVLLDRGTPLIIAQSAPAPVRAVAAPARPVEAPRGASEAELYDQLARQYAQFEHVNRTFEMVARVVSPAVVHIVAQKTGRVDESSRMRHYEETGSGVIVRGDRGKGLYVLTNNHVVEGSAAAKISIFLQDGRAIHPDQIWLDPAADIGVLNLNREDLPAARFGNSDDMIVGDWVLALGSPFGLTHSVSQGIISARSRHMAELPEVENQDFLQTDAAINPGNSGGPLVNMKGEVIGINNSIASNGGGNEGVGFSIPINLARWIMTQLVNKGRVNRGALGIDLHSEFRPEDAIALGLERPRGAWVDKVRAGSPAAAAGLRDGDVVLRFNGTDVLDLNHLINVVSMAEIGKPAEVVVWRARQRVALRVTIGDKELSFAASNANPDRPLGNRGGLLRRPERPAQPTAAALGAELETLDEATARRLGLPTNLRGAVVLNLAPDSPLASFLKPFDVIYSVNGHGITTAQDAVREIAKHVAPEGLLLGYDRFTKGVTERHSVEVK